MGGVAQGARAVAVVPRAVAVSPSPSLSPSYTLLLTTTTTTYIYSIVVAVSSRDIREPVVDIASHATVGARMCSCEER